MPPSALTTQQPEKLPAIENMTYQGQRAPAYNKPNQNVQTNRTTSEKPAPTNRLTKEQLKVISAPEPKLVEPTVPVKQTVERTQKTEQPKAKKPSPKTYDDYQKTFADILKKHNDDLLKISNRRYTESPDIKDLIESFKSDTVTLKETIYPRAVIGQ
jgi:hypothetical protein